MQESREYNFDGLVGPTHNYAGLSAGNIASTSNAHSTSYPKAAALQGLAKMKILYEMGIGQAVLPPQPRPDLGFLRHIGFTGSYEKMLNAAFKQAPHLFAASYSASAMWAANVATVSPNADTIDHKLHITPANLVSNIHRMIEAPVTYLVLKKIFADHNKFFVHEYLPQSPGLGDEGSANYIRFCNSYEQPGVALFVYNKEFYSKDKPQPKIFPARQTLEASQAIARQHGLIDRNICFLQQNPAAVDAGVFHNDVVAVGNKNLLLCHESAFTEQQASLEYLKNTCKQAGIDLKIEQVKLSDLPIKDMVESYLFNSQLISTDSHSMTLVAPTESENNPYARGVIESLLEKNNPINKVVYVGCKQSMLNGGGPACLRLRVVLSAQERQAITANVFFTDDLCQKLNTWVNKHYRESLSLPELLDPLLINESYTALDELTQILNIGSVYNFQH